MTSEAEIEDFFDQSPVGFVTTDQNWAITAISRTLRGWLDLPEDHGFIGQHLTSLLTSASRIYHETHYAPLVLQNGRVSEIAAEMRREGQSPLPVLLGSLALPEGGPWTTIRTSVVRVVERRRYEDELLAQRRRAEASEQRTATLLAAISDLVAADTVEDVSAALVRAGRSMPGIATTSIWMLEPGGGLREYGAGGATQRLLPLDAEHPVTACARSGQEVVEERLGMVAAPLGDPRLPSGVLLVAVPELVDMPQADRDLVFSLATQAGQALERARMHERREAVQKSAGHDVLSPLQTVLGHAMSLRELLDERLTESEHDAINRLIWNAERIHRLVDGFIELTSVEDDPGRIQRAPARLREIVDEAIATLEPVAETRDVQVDVTDTAQGLKLEVDLHLVTLAVTHLLEDAVMQSPRHGRVSVTIVAEGDAVTLSIRNDASGDRLPQETWVQVTNEDEAGRSGLALAVSEGILVAHGGHLVVDDGPGGGWASAVLPLARPQSSDATTS